VATTAARVRDALARLERLGTKAGRDAMARYAITAKKAFGVSVGDIRAVAKRLGRDHDLADPLWDSGWYEARLLVAFVADPARTTPAQMDRWVAAFDSWAVCDTLCFHLFDRSPHAWKKVAAWSRRRDEFGKRAAFALLASLALHDRTSGDEPFLRSLPLVERAAPDERNFVRKGVSWALRSIGQRSPATHAAAVDLARRLARSDDGAARWVGKDALRDLERPLVKRRMAARSNASGKRAQRAKSSSASASAP